MVVQKIFFSKIALIFLLALYFVGQAQGRTVTALEIKAVGLNDESLNDENEAKACKKFKPTKKQIIRFFNLAEVPANKAELLHERYSSCAAEGFVKFSDNSSGQWILKSSGVASITFNNRESIYLFYKNNKWEDPYACTYGLGDEEEC